MKAKTTICLLLALTAVSLTQSPSPYSPPTSIGPDTPPPTRNPNNDDVRGQFWRRFHEMKQQMRNSRQTHGGPSFFRIGADQAQVASQVATSIGQMIAANAQAPVPTEQPAAIAGGEQQMMHLPMGVMQVMQPQFLRNWGGRHHHFGRFQLNPVHMVPVNVMQPTGQQDPASNQTEQKQITVEDAQGVQRGTGMILNKFASEYLKILKDSKSVELLIKGFLEGSKLIDSTPQCQAATKDVEEILKVLINAISMQAEGFDAMKSLNMMVEFQKATSDLKEKPQSWACIHWGQSSLKLGVLKMILFGDELVAKLKENQQLFAAMGSLTLQLQFGLIEGAGKSFAEALNAIAQTPVSKTDEQIANVDMKACISEIVKKRFANATVEEKGSNKIDPWRQAASEARNNCIL